MNARHLKTAAYSAPIISATIALIADANPVVVVTLALAWLWAEVRSLIHHTDADRWRVLAADRKAQLDARDERLVLSWRGGES